MLEDATQLVSAELASMDLPQSLEAASMDATTPPPLCDQLQRICMGGGPSRLVEMLKDLTNRGMVPSYHRCLHHFF
jgi:hypothetical protein|tara:strand:+ start:150 stop:377 length:228 start_codon:yes stop_codon:yes gene_type:complete